MDSLLQALESGSDEELALRGEWLSRLMFGNMSGPFREPWPYEEWLRAVGYELV